MSISPDELCSKVQDLLNKAELPDRHTFFQMKNFIIGKEVTVQGQLWQILRELRVRNESLTSLSEQLQDIQDDIALCDIAVERLRSPSEKEDELGPQERAIKTRKVERQRSSLERAKETLQKKSKYLLEEMAYFASAFEKLNNVQELKPLDDVASQQEYWNEKLTEELNLRLLLRSPLDCDFVKTILSLDDSMVVKQNMIAIINKAQQTMIAERDREMTLKADLEHSKHKALLKKQGGI